MGESQQETKHFTAKKKAQIVMDIFQGKTTVAEVSRKYDLTPAMIEKRRHSALKYLVQSTLFEKTPVEAYRLAA